MAYKDGFDVLGQECQRIGEMAKQFRLRILPGSCLSFRWSWIILKDNMSEFCFITIRIIRIHNYRIAYPMFEHGLTAMNFNPFSRSRPNASGCSPLLDRTSNRIWVEEDGLGKEKLSYNLYRWNFLKRSYINLWHQSSSGFWVLEYKTR